MSDKSTIDQYLIDHLENSGWTRASYFSMTLGTGDLEHQNDNLRIRVKHISKANETLLELQPSGKGRIHLLLPSLGSPVRLVDILKSWQDRLSEGNLLEFMKEIQAAYPQVQADRTGTGDWATLSLGD